MAVVRPSAVEVNPGRIVVVGAGMVAHRFVAQLRELSPQGEWSVLVIGDEPYAPYDRVHLSDLFTGHSADDLLLDPSDMGEASPATPATPGGADLQEYLDQVERHVIEEALEKSGGNRTAAARALGVTFRSLRYRLERLGIKE